jgi:hypothetical protein
MAHPKNKMSAESKALVSTLNSDDRKIKPKVEVTPKVTVESQESKDSRAASKALVKTLNSDDRNRHHKSR